MAEVTLAINYLGPAVEEGRIEVAELAPSLLALAALFREANDLLYPDAPPVSLEVTATGRGSFEVQLALSQPEWVGRTLDFFTSDTAEALWNLKEWIAGGAGGLMLFLRWLRNRRIAREERTEDGIKITLDDQTSMIIPEAVLQLANNVSIRKRARQVVEPLRRDDYEAIQFRGERSRQVSVEIRSDDLPAFDVEEGDPVAEEQEFGMVVAIDSVPFRPGLKWRFADGNSSFTADMEDPGFLQRVERGEESFRKGDRLRCRIRVRQTETDSNLKTAWSVVRVLEHIPASRTIPLGEAADGESGS